MGLGYGLVASISWLGMLRCANEGFGAARDHFGLEKGAGNENFCFTAPAHQKGRRRRTPIPSATVPLHPTAYVPAYGLKSATQLSGDRRRRTPVPSATAPPCLLFLNCLFVMQGPLIQS